MDHRLILIGKAVRAQGTKGKIKVKPFADLDVFLSADRLYLGKDAADGRYFKVLTVQVHKGAVLLELGGVNTMNLAEEIAGSGVYADKDTLPKLHDGEYYWFEIMGLSVLTEDGRCLGRIEKIFPTGSNDVYVVREGKKEYLIPAIDDVIKEINVTGGQMIIRLVEGLLGEG